MKLSERRWNELKIIGMIPLVIFVPTRPFYGLLVIAALLVQGAAAYAWINHEQKKLLKEMKDLEDEFTPKNDKP